MPLPLPLARLMEGGLEDKETCRELNNLTKILNDDSKQDNRSEDNYQSLYQLIDTDCVEALLGYMDLRKSQIIRSHATITISAYLKAALDGGNEKISKFFLTKVKNATHNDYILAFSVAACLFPIIPDLISTLFLSERFIPSLGILMKKKWKNKKTGQAALELVNAACMNTPCREAIRSSCTEWLEEILHEALDSSTHDIPGKTTLVEDNSLPPQVYFELVRNLAAVVLAKLQATPSTSNSETEERIQRASISIEELSDNFKKMLLSTSSQQNSIEGLAYASLQPKVKEFLASDEKFLKKLIMIMKDAAAKSPVTYGATSILFNLTFYKPVLSEEQKRLGQLKKYANPSKSSKSTKYDHLDEDEYVTKRCLAVFEAGVIPVLVSHSQHGSISSLTFVVSIIASLSRTPKIRGKMAQQGAVKLLLHAYSTFQTDNHPALRTTAHALARILITTNPLHTFGGSNPISITSAIRPLVLILSDDPSAQTCDLLSVFESLLALTNLASTDDTARNLILRLACPRLDDLILSNNVMVTRAAVELICNLVQSPEGAFKFADGQHMQILLAFTDAEDVATRRAAGGAMASLTEWDQAVEVITKKDRGIKPLLALCREDEEDLRHRGVVCILNIISTPGEVGEQAAKKIKDENGIHVLKECLKKSKSQEVLDIAVMTLKKLLKDDKLGPELLESN